MRARATATHGGTFAHRDFPEGWPATPLPDAMWSLDTLVDEIAGSRQALSRQGQMGEDGGSSAFFPYAFRHRLQ